MFAFDEAIASPAGSGRQADAFGVHVIRVFADSVGGALGVFETEVPAGDGPPLHVHDRADEVVRVLAGRFGFWCGDAPMVELGPGGVIALPRGVPHRFRNVGRCDGRLMTVVTPGGFEGFFGAVAAIHPATPAELATVAARFGMRLLDGAVQRIAA